MRTQLAEASGEVMGRLSAASMESYSRAYPSLVRLHMLQARVPAAIPAPFTAAPAQLGALARHAQTSCMRPRTARHPLLQNSPGVLERCRLACTAA